MRGFLDDKRDVLKSSWFPFVTDIATKYPCARSTARGNDNLYDDPLGFFGDVGARYAEVTSLAEKQVFESQG